MCGIAGFVDLDGSMNENREKYINEMLNTIIHRGPDGQGVYYDNIVTLGHRRLSIIDLSDNGTQPMKYQDRYVITYNGEIYNYLELKEELKAQGYNFYTKTDTEVLLSAYDFWGEECINHFNGMWAFCIYDRENQKLFCSRDRFGIKPFYYCKKDEYFSFASEIKELFCLTNENPKANHEKLLTYLVCGAVDYSEETMFQGVFQLLGGHNLTFDLNKKSIQISKWYNIEDIKIENQSFEDNIELFHDKFFNSIDLRLRADVPVGSCLSGGLDSSSIVCAINKRFEDNNNKTEQHVVSSCFEDKTYDEQEYIDEVVKSTDVTCHKIFPDMNEIFTEMDDIIWHMDEPFGSTSIYAQWCVFKEAKENNLTVMLDGQGADEQLGGYTEFYNVLFAKLLKKVQLKKFVTEVKKYQELRGVTEVSSRLNIKIVKSFINVMVPQRVKSFIKGRYDLRNFNMPFDKKHLNNKTIKAIFQQYNDSNEKEFFCLSMQQNLPTLLHYEDRDSMAFSIESRVPFLDYEVVRASLSIPIEQKIVNGITKSVLREALKEVLPEKVYSRYSKLGFVTPEDKWIKENKDLIRCELEEAGELFQEFVDKENLIKWFDKNVNSFKRGDFTVWRIICAAHWVKVFNVKLS